MSLTLHLAIYNSASAGAGGGGGLFFFCLHRAWWLARGGKSGPRQFPWARAQPYTSVGHFRWPGIGVKARYEYLIPSFSFEAFGQLLIYPAVMTTSGSSDVEQLLTVWASELRARPNKDQPCEWGFPGSGQTVEWGKFSRGEVWRVGDPNQPVPSSSRVAAGF